MEHQIENRRYRSNTHSNCWQQKGIQTLIVCFSVGISDGLRSSVFVRVINHHHTRALLTSRSTAGGSDGSSTCVIRVLRSCLICTLEKKSKPCFWVYNRVIHGEFSRNFSRPSRAQLTEPDSCVGACLYHSTSTAVALLREKKRHSRV